MKWCFQQTQPSLTHALSTYHTWCIILHITGVRVCVRLVAGVGVAVRATAGIAAVTAAVLQAWLVCGGCQAQGILLPTAISAGCIAGCRIVGRSLGSAAVPCHDMLVPELLGAPVYVGSCATSRTTQGEEASKSCGGSIHTYRRA